MAYQSWSVVFGEQPSAAKWNILGSNDASFNDGTGIGDGAVTPAKWTNPYCFRAWNSASTTLTDNTFVKILFATEDYDYSNNFASSTYTAPVAGVYHFDTAVYYASGVGTSVEGVTMFYKNGSAEIFGQNFTISGASGPCYTASGDMLLAANDTVEVYHFQNSAGNEATSNDRTKTWFSGHLVHPV